MTQAEITSLRIALAIAYRTGLRFGLKTLVRAIYEGRSVDLIVVRAAMRKMAADTWRLQKKLYRSEFAYAVGGDFTDYRPLEQLILERQRLHADRIAGYQNLYEQSARGSILIGRRGQDIVRELGVNMVEQTFIEGAPATMGKRALHTLMVQRGRADLATMIENGYDPAAEIMQHVPIFHKSGTPHFYLKNKHGKYMAFSVEGYAELVAATTSEEADRIAQPERARKLGTRLVEFNRTGRGKAYYLSINDTRCAAVDGETFSIEEGGSWVNGVYYRYWRDVLPGEFVNCHPFCQHFMRPKAEALAA